MTFLRRRAGPPAPDETGFTLIELLMVLFVVTLIVGVVIPSLGGFGENRIATESRRAASLLRYLNDSAVATKERFSIEFDFARKTIHYKGPDEEKTESFDTLVAVELPSRGVVSEGQLTVFFGPAGAYENIKIRLAGDKRNMTATLNNLSGRVKLKEEL